MRPRALALFNHPGTGLLARRWHFGRAKRDRFKNGCRRPLNGAGKSRRLYWRGPARCPTVAMFADSGSAVEGDAG